MSEIDLLEMNKIVLENPPHVLSRNEEAKRRMADELALQGLSVEVICRLLNISPDLLKVLC